MSNQVKVTYNYPNREQGVTKLWLAWPEKAQGLNADRDPSVITPSTDDLLAFYELDEGEGVEVRWTAGKYVPQKEQLTEEMRSFYLRSTVLCPVNDEMEKLAWEITEGTGSERDQAEKLFVYLVDHYKYVYPPKSRGAADFLRDKKGDCGEYSFLYAALCRSLGIPCRTIVGSWAVGTMQGHVWNEVYIGDSWIPVDASMAYIQKKDKMQFFFSDVKTLNWKRYFGHTEGQRIVFSHDAEIPLSPAYDEVDSEKLISANPPSFFNIAGKPFYWGYETVGEAAPYLQPAYIRFDDRNLAEGRKPDDNSYLGKWSVKETGFRRLAFILKRLSIVVYILTIILGFIFDSHMVELVNRTALLLGAGSFLLRGERTLVFGAATVLALLSFLSALENG